MSTVLLIEDDAAMARVMRKALEDRSYGVQWVETASEAKLALQHARPDLIMLDLTLPDTDGLLLTSTLKSLSPAPVIICSARRKQVDRVLGLKLGADDYISKPFDVDELEARVEAVLRRATRARQAPAAATDDIQVGRLSISRTRATVTYDGRRVQLTPTEFRLMLAFATRPGEVVSREALGEVVWGCSDEALMGHVIDVHVGRLRNKLRVAGCTEPLIVTVRGNGYRLDTANSRPVEMAAP